MRKAQVTMEFTIIMLFMMIMFSGVFIALQSTVSQLKIEDNYNSMEELAFLIMNEVQLAYSVGDGYRREFIIPSHLNGINYSLALQDSEDLVVYMDSQEYVAFLEVPVVGTLGKGIYKIRNQNGIVYIDPS